MSFIQRNLPSLIALSAMIVFSFVVFEGLPDQVPSNYNIRGEVTDTQPKWLMVSLSPLIYFIVLLMV
ncbi:MAG: DUF1648 domain-containing protein, partial [Gammaproteobacteria bacterium]|nr:DUF1648 domain-containing protein [Gammaproteobacteria bacterium]